MEKIKRIRMSDWPVKRIRMADLRPSRPRRQSRGPNKPKLITDGRQVVARKELAAMCGVSVDTVKKWQSKTPGDGGLKPVRFGPNGRSVYYNIDEAARYTGVPLRARRAPDPTSGAPAAPPPPSEQAA